jgi:Co/Zn/Cd efflux system component
MIFNFATQATSVWVWLAPVLTFCGTLVLFTGSMFVLWRTNKAALNRQTRELDAKKEEAKANRAAARADQLRVEVAAILAERPTTLDSQRALFDATFQHRVDIDANRSPAERSRKVLDVRQLHIEHSDKLEQLVIRALLLTTDPEIEAALSKVRAIAHNWNEPMLAAQATNDVEKFDELRKRLTDSLDELEAATRKLTAVDAA